MYCKYCGNEVPEGSKFCPSCGRAIDYAAAQGGSAQPNQHADYEQADSGQPGYGQPGYDRQAGYEQPGTERPASGSSAMDRFLAVIGPQPYFTVGSYLVWGGCFISFVSLFLCFCTVTLFSTHLVSIMELNGSGWLIVLLLAIAVLNLFRLYAGDLLCTGAVTVLIWHYAANIDELLDVFSYSGGLFGTEIVTEGVISFSFGFYVMIFGILLMLIGAVWGLVSTILEYREAQS